MSTLNLGHFCNRDFGAILKYKLGSAENVEEIFDINSIQTYITIYKHFTIYCYGARKKV